MLRAEKKNNLANFWQASGAVTHFKISISSKIETVALIIWILYLSICIYLNHMDNKNANLLLEIERFRYFFVKSMDRNSFFFVVVVSLFNVHGKQLWACWNGQLT